MAPRQRLKAVISFGRMNPPTTGHQLLVDKMEKIARDRKAEPILYLSHSQDKKKNPLPYADKVRFGKRAFDIVQNSKARNIIEVLKELQKKGFRYITLVVGSDRVREMNALIQKYNGKEYKFQSLETISAGERDPDASDVSGMSASKMRELALRGKEKEFIKGLPPKLRIMGNTVFNATRKGMGLNPMKDGKEKENKYIGWTDKLSSKELKSLSDETNIDEVLSLQQRMKKRLTIRRLKAKIKRGKRIAKYKLAPKEKLEKRAARAARRVLRKRLAGKQGVNYNKLPLASRAQIDKRLATKKAMIKKIGKRLMPKVRKAEHERLASVRQQKKESFNVYRLDNKFFDDEGLYGVVNELLVRIENEELTESALNNLQKKSDKYKVSLDTLKNIYIEAKLEWDSTSDQTAEQYAFQCVNTYLANRLREALSGTAQRSAKNAIDREKVADRQRHDRMMDQARIQDAKKKARARQQSVRAKNAAT